MNEVMGTVKAHFRTLLMPRNRGMVAVIETETGFLVSLGCHSPFMALNFLDTCIELIADYPSQLKESSIADSTWEQLHTQLVSFSKVPKVRRREVADLAQRYTSAQRSVLKARDGHWRHVKFDIFHAESITKAECFTNAIITHVKYLITNGFGTWRPKDNIELVDLVELATKKYRKQIQRA